MNEWREENHNVPRQTRQLAITWRFELFEGSDTIDGMIERNGCGCPLAKVFANISILNKAVCLFTIESSDEITRSNISMTPMNKLE